MGDALTGKTHCMCSWPDTVLIAFDPDTQTARKLPGVTIVEVGSWDEFESKVLPHINNRTMADLVDRPVSTIAVDTISVGSMRLAAEIQGTKERMTIGDFGLLLNKLTAVTMQIVDATRQHTDSQPTYHTLFSTHLSPETDPEGNVRGIRPAIMGQFKQLLPRLTGFAFLCEVRKEVKSGKAPGQMTTSVVRGVHTIPPDTRYICGDRIGGSSIYRELPAFTGGNYQDLMDAWGMDLDAPGGVIATTQPNAKAANS